MKKLPLLVLACLLFTIACRKDKDKAAPPDQSGQGEELTAAITTEIAGIDSLSSFKEYLKDLKISDADAAAGITVLAPVNSAFVDPGGRKAAPDGSGLREALPDSSNLEDYIVKGIFPLTALTDGKKLTTLSGNTLTVSKDGEDTRINGILLGTKELASSDKSVVYSLAGLIKKSPAITVTVWDAARWAAGKPKGTVAEGVTVSLYHSQEDYASGKAAAYTATTGADGKAKFKDLAAGVYYILAEKGDESNVLKQPGFWNAQPGSTLFTGFAFDSVFQSQGEVDAAPQQPNQVVGNVRFVDANMDGRIDNNDYVGLPFQSATAEAGNGVAVSVMIGYSSVNLATLPDMDEARNALAYGYTQTAISYFNINMLDGYLSDDVDGVQNRWMSIDMFGFTPADANITTPWNAYQGALPQLNRIIRDVPSMPDATDKASLVAQAKALRAHIYLQLLTYYGNIPLMTGVFLPAGVTNNEPEKVYDLIISDLQAAEADLPAQWPSGEGYRVTSSAASALLAKAALLNKDYASAATYAKKVINSSQYQLAASGDIFNTAYNKEVIWDVTDLNQTSEFKAYFTKGNRCPVIRLSELYLVASESMLEQSGVSAEVSNMLNTLCARSGYAPITPGASQSTVRGQLRDIWKQEMKLEENRYVCLQRWGIAAQVLGPKGYMAPKNDWLPVPLSFMNNYPSLMQHAGY
jgi:hypothetical protein